MWSPEHEGEWTTAQRKESLESNLSITIEDFVKTEEGNGAWLLNQY